MRTRTIRIDDEVFAELQRLAVEFNMQLSTPNNVLRRALLLSPPEKPIKEHHEQPSH
jgi:predicted transcriptional regulator